MGKQHADCITESNVFRLVAICSQSADVGTVEAQYGVQLFSCLDELLNDKRCDVDVVIIATPHRQHAGAVVAALQSNKHVICEKPLTVSGAEADQVLRANINSNATLTVVSQNRFEPSYRFVKNLLVSGELGPIRRCSITETFWRSNAYYASADWRGTWWGEGGGVLMNQAPHVIDRYVWLCGAPTEVTAICDTQLHNIDVEDSATLIFRHEDGLQGHIHVNTNECPSQSRLEISCDKGRVCVQDGRIKLDRLAKSVLQETNESSDGFGKIDFTTENLNGHLLNWAPELLHSFYEDFAEAIFSNRPPEVTPQQAHDVVEIINAGHLSSWQQSRVQLPVDRQQYADFQQAMLASK